MSSHLCMYICMFVPPSWINLWTNLMNFFETWHEHKLQLFFFNGHHGGEKENSIYPYIWINHGEVVMVHVYQEEISRFKLRTVPPTTLFSSPPPLPTPFFLLSLTFPLPLIIYFICSTPSFPLNLYFSLPFLPPLYTFLFFFPPISVFFSFPPFLYFFFPPISVLFLSHPLFFFQIHKNGLLN